MIPSQINAAIARSRGYTWISVSQNGGLWGLPPRTFARVAVPHYTENLNSIHSAVLALPKHVRVRYTHELLCQTVWTGKYHASHVHSDEDLRWGIASASALQCATAYLRALDLWEKGAAR